MYRYMKIQISTFLSLNMAFYKQPEKQKIMNYKCTLNVKSTCFAPKGLSAEHIWEQIMLLEHLGF